MGYEIDFLPVGTSGPGGDAIAVRFGDLESAKRDDWFVAIIDGGRMGTGSKLVDHVRTHFGTDRVDVVVSTHSDADHITGLSTVLEELTVGALWINDPPTPYREELQKSVTASSGQLRRWTGTIIASLRQRDELADLAASLGVEVIRPLAGLEAANGAVRVIGPSEAYYDDLAPRFRDFEPTRPYQAVVADALEEKGVTMTRESLDHETLAEGGRTSPENNSSVITLLDLDDATMVLTGDAGIEGLTHAADFLDQSGFD